MNNKIFVPALATLVALSFAISARADEESTTTTTTTRTVSSSNFVLPVGQTFVVVDPLSGDVRGALDPASCLLNGQPLTPGMIISENGTGRVIAVVDANGNLMDIATAPVTASLLSSIEARRIELDRLLTQALADGRITATQATAIRSEMDRLVTQEAALKQGGTAMTYAQVLPIAYGYTVLSNTLVPITHTTIAPLIGRRIVVDNGVILLANDLEFRRIALERRVDDEYSAGRLSAKQVSELKERLGTVRSLQAKYSRDGVISSSDQRKLEKRLDEVKVYLERDIAYINGKRAKIGIRVN